MVNRKKQKGDSDISLLTEMNDRLKKLELLEKAKEIEGKLEASDEEPKSQMFTVSTEFKDVTGDFTDLLTKSRFEDYDDVAFQIEAFVERFYNNMDGTRFGHDSILIKVSDVDEGKVNLSEFQRFQIWKEKIHDVWYYRIIVFINAIRKEKELYGRIAAFNGYSRIDHIHGQGAKNIGQGYIENHAPPPNIFSKENKNPYNKKGAPKLNPAEAVGDAVFESEKKV